MGEKYQVEIVYELHYTFEHSDGTVFKTIVKEPITCAKENFRSCIRKARELKDDNRN